MTQPRYLLRESAGKYRIKGEQVIGQADLVLVANEEYTKRDDSGLFPVLRSTGKVRRDVIRVMVHVPKTINGFAGRSMAAVVPRSAAGIKSALRELRPTDAETLDAIDEQIDGLKARLSQLQRQRRSALRDAWNKGYVVRLSECEAAIEPDRQVGWLGKEGNDGDRNP